MNSSKTISMLHLCPLLSGPWLATHVKRRGGFECAFLSSLAILFEAACCEVSKIGFFTPNHPILTRQEGALSRLHRTYLRGHSFAIENIY